MTDRNSFNFETFLCFQFKIFDFGTSRLQERAQNLQDQVALTNDNTESRLLLVLERLNFSKLKCWQYIKYGGKSCQREAFCKNKIILPLPIFGPILESILNNEFALFCNCDEGRKVSNKEIPPILS